MRTNLIVLTILTVAFGSCKKEALNSSSLQSVQTSNRTVQALGQIQQDSTFNIVDNGNGTFTATLQPDSTNGQDVYVYKVLNSAGVAYQNFDSVPELYIAGWTDAGGPAFARAYLKFADLTRIPSTVQVLSATLYLYGVSNSTEHPQGNSVYPGSPYTKYGTNRCIIQPVDNAWGENALTWWTQPDTLNRGKVNVPASTSQWNYDVALSDVKGMVSKAIKYPNGNNGVRISLAEEYTKKSMVFASSESVDPTKRPKLVVTYSN